MYMNIYIKIYGKLDKSDVIFSMLIRDYCNKFSDNFALLKTIGVCLKNLLDYQERMHHFCSCFLPIQCCDYKT